jgi:3-dehydro-L-gulonate 2-dehydrogenase
VILKIEDLRQIFFSKLQHVGFTSSDAGSIADIFTENTRDGVFSHGINRFPRFIGDVLNGTVIPNRRAERVQGSGALEQWDGNGAAGPLNALQALDQSINLAREYGIGCIGLRNTNHWMRGGSYGWKAADQGFLFMGWTNTQPNMPPWDGDKAALGNNPFVMAIPRKKGHIVVDMAMSQFSYGKLEWHEKLGTELSHHGGYDSHNELTKNPSEILKTGRILPTGLWKGSALSLILDLAAAVLSGGLTTREIGKLPGETRLSQVFISIDIGRHMDQAQMETLEEETLQYLKQTNPDAAYPGQRSLRNRKLHAERGVEIQEKIWEEILAL